MMRSFFGKVAQRFRRRGPPGLYYISPGVNWSLDWDGYYTTREVEKQFGLKARVARTAERLSGQIVHYGSLWDMAANVGARHNERNVIVGTIFHGLKDDPLFKETFDRVLSSIGEFDKIHTASSVMQQRLLAWGVPAEKLICIPLGVDLKVFAPVNEEQKQERRREFGILRQAICIGSFHKDGVGMGEGTEPKLIKGPDIFLKVVEAVSKQHPVFVLLSAPARGYVKAGLERLGIPYKHMVLDDYLQIPRLYQALDMYLLTSREEGGPKGVIESLATGVPLVATKVGLAPDVIIPGENGFLAESEDVPSLAAHVIELIDHPDIRARFIASGLKTIASYDWSLIAARYYAEIYKPILDQITK